MNSLYYQIQSRPFYKQNIRPTQSNRRPMKLSPTSIKHLGDQYSIKNSVYISTQSAKNPNKIINVMINGKILKCAFHKAIEKGQIGMSLNIRKYLGLNQTAQPVLVQPYELNDQLETALSYLELQIDLVKPKEQIGKKIEITEEDFVNSAVKKELQFFFNPDESKYFPYTLNGKEYLFSGRTTKCLRIQTGSGNSSKGNTMPGRLTDQTQVKLKGLNKIIIKSEQDSVPSIFRPDFNITDMGIGGLDSQLFDIFRRTFASRRYSNETVKKFGVKHVKGILLYGPPGTGKTLIARQLAKALNVKDLKIVNGPQIFSRFVGESEENIRKLFAEARADEQKLGDKSPLHIIVFDEIDAICKQRGLSADTGSQVGDQVVNQLLTNIDGVQALNNILVIGMTNRKDLIDQAILRPGRFEVHIEIGLPTEQGRLQILQIHTKQLQKNGLLHPKCNLNELARLTKNYTGAEIQAVVKSATSHSICRTTNIMEFDKELVIDNVKLGVTMQDFLKALEQVRPQFGFDEEKFSVYFKQKMINYGERYTKIWNLLQNAAQMKDNLPNQKRAVLLYGSGGNGKTSIALNYAKHSKFSYVKFITPDNFIGLTDMQKVLQLSKIFENAYKTTSACIVVDSIEKLVNYHPSGRRFSNSILQALLVFIDRKPSHQSSKLLIIGTSSTYFDLKELQLVDRFDSKINIPNLNEQERATFIAQKNQIPELARKISPYLKGASIDELVLLSNLVENKNDPNEWIKYYNNLIKSKKIEENEENHA